jgi:hypothetical protein
MFRDVARRPKRIIPAPRSTRITGYGCHRIQVSRANDMDVSACARCGRCPTVLGSEQPNVDRHWFGSALQADAVEQKLQPLEVYPVGTCGADFAAYLREQLDEYARVIREADIKAD